MITAVRAALLAAGIWLGWYGVSMLLEFDTRDLISIALWFIGGILVHDALFAPLSAAAGLAARRILPQGWWGPVACGAVCTAALVLIAVPVIGRENARPDNPTVLDRAYPAGLTVALTVVWTLVVLAGAASRRARRKNQQTGQA